MYDHCRGVQVDNILNLKKQQWMIVCYYWAGGWHAAVGLPRHHGERVRQGAQLQAAVWQAKRETGKIQEAIISSLNEKTSSRIKAKDDWWGPFLNMADEGNATLVICLGEQKCLFHQFLLKYILTSIAIIEIDHTRHIWHAIGEAFRGKFCQQISVLETWLSVPKSNQWKVVKV